MIEDVINKYLEKRQVKNIKIIGDICLDEYIFGKVKSLAKEAPALALHINERIFEAGQAGNVASNCSSLGSKLQLYTFIGLDKQGELLHKLIADKGITLITPKIKDKKIPTTHRIKVVSEDEQTGYHHLLHIYNEIKCKDLFSKYLWEELIANANADDIICVSDYLLGIVREDYIKMAINKGLYIIINTRDNLSKFNGSRGIICNNSDIERLNSKGTLREKILETRKSLNLEWLIVTLGGRGMILCCENEIIRRDAINVKVVDITGAGDASFAAIISALSREMSIEDSFTLANISGAACVSLRGTGNITTDMIKEKILNLKHQR